MEHNHISKDNLDNDVLLWEDAFAVRLNELRTKKNVSARDMSLSIGQNAAYINNIESRKALPSMSGFLYICDYLQITPQEFFDAENASPVELRDITNQLKHLEPRYINAISALVDGLG